MSNKNFESTKYNSLVRKVVRDVTKIIKSGDSGLFILPEYFSNEITYRYSGLGTEFEVTVVIIKDDTVTNFILDGGYYSDDNEIELMVKYNPEKFPKMLYEFIGEVNEVFSHELQHLIQDVNGRLTKPKSNVSPLQYYLEPNELESQFVGFKRRSKVSGVPMDKLVENWVSKYGLNLGLDIEDTKILTDKIVNYR